MKDFRIASTTTAPQPQKLRASNLAVPECFWRLINSRIAAISR